MSGPRTGSFENNANNIVKSGLYFYSAEKRTFIIKAAIKFDTIVEGPGATQYRKIYSYDEGAYVDNNIQYRAGFDRKQNKYMAVIPNNTQTPIAGEVVFGNQTTGIKAYYATVTMKTDTTTDPNGLKELFAVGSTFAPR